MKQKKYTKRALRMSLLSMLLCCSMLIGTTFAWFTDSVTSGRNQIVAGNLDVELYHGTGTSDADKVTSETRLFRDKDGKEILWEPGVMAYENFTVKNVGTLALKYVLSMNVYEFNTVTDSKGVAHSLADVIKVAILDKHFEGDRDDALAEDFTHTVTDFVKEKDKLLPTDAGDKFAVILYWEPSDDDNLYNLNNERSGQPQLYIDLGVNLYATQTPHENDSFGDQYDKDAELFRYSMPASQDALDAFFSPGPGAESGLTYENGNAIIQSTGAWHQEPVDLTKYIYTLEYDVDASKLTAGQYVAFDGGHTIDWTGINFSVNKEGVCWGYSNEGDPQTMDTGKLHVKYVYMLMDGKLAVEVVLTDGTNTLKKTVTGAGNSTVNNLYWDVYSVSEGAGEKVSFTNFTYYAETAPETVTGTPGGLQDAINKGEDGGEIELGQDLDVTKAGSETRPNYGIDVEPGKDVTLNGDGNTVTLDHTAFNHFDINEGITKGTLTFKNVNFKGKDESQNGYVTTLGFDAEVDVVFENCIFTNMFSAVYINANTSGHVKVTFKNCTFVNCKYACGMGDAELAEMEKEDGTVKVVFEGTNTNTPDPACGWKM